MNHLILAPTAATCRKSKYDGEEEFWVVTRETGTRMQEMSSEQIRRETAEAGANA